MKKVILNIVYLFIAYVLLICVVSFITGCAFKASYGFNIEFATHGDKVEEYIGEYKNNK